MIQFSKVSKEYDDVTALCDVTIEFQPQRTYVLLGTSGCGKSTILKLTLGLIEPTTGSVSIEGELLKPQTILDVRRRVGYVIQDGGLFPHLTAADNVALVSRYLGWKSERIAARLREMAELVQIPVDSLQRFPSQLSGGQQQRVGLMRALMLDPPVLLLDEPLGALDPIVRSELQQDLRTIFRQLKKTVVMVTHDLHEAAYFADEILLLHQGRIVQQGTIDDLLQSPATDFVARFVTAQRSTLPGVQA